MMYNLKSKASKGYSMVSLVMPAAGGPGGEKCEHDSESSSSRSCGEEISDIESADAEAAREVSMLADGDTKKITLWRILTAFLLLATGAVVSIATYYLLSRQFDSDCRHTVRIIVTLPLGLGLD
jgi:hypothetical protein